MAVKFYYKHKSRNKFLSLKKYNNTSEMLSLNDLKDVYRMNYKNYKHSSYTIK